MLNFLSIIFALLAIIILLMIVAVISSILKYEAGNILLPGLGIVISTRFVLAILIIAEVVVVALVALFAR